MGRQPEKEPIVKTKQIVLSTLVAVSIFAAASSVARADQPSTSSSPAPVPPPAADKAAASTADTDLDAPKTGFMIRAELPLVMQQGSLFKGEDALGPGVGFGAHGGYYFTPHLGVLGGAQLSIGHSQSNCDGCKGTTLELPLYIEIAQNRVRGLYGDVGVALLPTASLTDATGATVSLQGLADAKIGFGYRMSQHELIGGTNRSLVALSIFTSASAGKYSSVSIQDGGNHASADVADEKQDFHYTLSAGVGVAFLP
jgi:hypothetical protein